jgi:hypothetical protein
MIRLSQQITFLLILTIFTCQSWANTYDHLLLRAEASIFPKIVLLDKHLDKKSADDIVSISIIHTEKDAYIAQQLLSSIKDKYGDNLGNKKLLVTLNSFNDIDKNSPATAYIVLQGSGKKLKKAISFASSNNRIVFSYSYTDFKHNALISLHVKEKTYIYLNKSAVQLYDIKFLPVFYKLTKIIE